MLPKSSVGVEWTCPLLSVFSYTFGFKKSTARCYNMNVRDIQLHPHTNQVITVKLICTMRWYNWKSFTIRKIIKFVKGLAEDVIQIKKIKYVPN